jgi:hypothetical protein
MHNLKLFGYRDERRSPWLGFLLQESIGQPKSQMLIFVIHRDCPGDLPVWIVREPPQAIHRYVTHGLSPHEAAGSPMTFHHVGHY